MAPSLTAIQLCERLASVPPLRLAAVALYSQVVENQVGVAELVQRQGEIEQALAQLDDHVVTMIKVVKRCERLTGVASQLPPLGF
jgi:hypothetical protein